MQRVTSGTQVRRSSRRSGFTLIELLLVMVILSILATVVTMKFTGISEKANISAAKAQISIFRTALAKYEVDNGHFPYMNEGGLSALVVNPGLSTWNTGGYLDKMSLPQDPWKHDYAYASPGTNGADYDLYSTGPDGQSHIEP